MKIMALSAGRKNGNSDLLAKIALSECEALGADVTFINLHDYNILDCTGCTTCTRSMAQGKYPGCVLDEKDDKKKIMDVMLDCDGVIIAVPTYDLMANSLYVRFAQRSLSYETSFREKIGVLEHKDRVAGLISVGGSTRAWQSMALESLQATMFTTDMTVVDMLLSARTPGVAQCMLNDELVEKAKQLGRNIVAAAKLPEGQKKWLGDPDMGWCPHCHSNALVLGELQWDGLHYEVECQVCGCGGTLEKVDGKWKFVIDPEKGYIKDRTTVAGRGLHLDEIGHTEGGYYANPENVKEAQKRAAPYLQKQFKGI